MVGLHGLGRRPGPAANQGVRRHQPEGLVGSSFYLATEQGAKRCP